jgi:uncharacterized protein YndB with AHSA1/START domain
MENSIIIKKKINASIEKVWKALTDKNELPSWYFDIADFEAEVGKFFNFYEPGEEKKYLHTTWNLESDANGTFVTLTHEGTEKLKDLGEGFAKESFTQGWNEIIGQSLKLYLEN